MLSITTDYATDHGDPEPYLRAIAEAGFTHIHWCHHWRADFLYADAEIEQIGRWLKQYGLILNDVHGSEGIEKFWYSPKEYARQAGVELVKNRLDFAARLGADAIVMHVYPDTVAPNLRPYNEIAWAQLRRTLDELEPYARQRGVTIAIENLIDSVGIHAGAVALPDAADNFDRIEALFSLYAADFLTHCYDSGHAHLGYDRMERLDPIKERLTVLHLHDNDGSGDQHRLLFQDTIQWERLASLIAQSGYTKPISMEVSMRHSGIDDEAEFLRQAFETGARFAKMVAQAQNAV